MRFSKDLVCCIAASSLLRMAASFFASSNIFANAHDQWSQNMRDLNSLDIYIARNVLLPAFTRLEYSSLTCSNWIEKDEGESMHCVEVSCFGLAGILESSPFKSYNPIFSYFTMS